MNGGTIAEALAPLRARMPAIVQEREILRIVATVAGDDGQVAMSEAQRQVLVWAQKRCGGWLPDFAWQGASFEHLPGGRTTLGVRLTEGEADIWSIRCDDPDKSVAGRVWTTEVTIGCHGRLPPQFGVRLIVSSAEEQLAINPHVPGLVQQVATICGLRVGGDPVMTEPWVIDTDDDVEELIRLVEGSHRTIPVVIASGDERASDPTSSLIDLTALVRATLGICHVALLPAHRTFALTEALGRLRSVFHGGVRIYWPGFDASADPFQHQLFVGDAVRADPDRYLNELRRLLAEASVRRTRLGYDVPAFTAVRSGALRLEQIRKVGEGANDHHLLEAANKRIDALEAEMETARGQATQSFDLAQMEEARALTAEALANAARARIFLLEQQLQAKGLSPDQDLEFPAEWEGFADWCDQKFVGRLVLASAARRGVRKPLFEDVGLASRSTAWLAVTCRDRRLEGGGSLANLAIEPGLENAPCGGDTFEFDFQGRRLTADWHVKSGGNTRDPSRCLRIYYAFDAVTQQIVVADMPAHRRTAAS